MPNRTLLQECLDLPFGLLVSYIIFTKAREEFAARLTLNEKLLERKKVTKIVGVFLEEKGG